MGNSWNVGVPTKSRETRARTFSRKVRKTLATTLGLSVTVCESLIQVGKDFPVTLPQTRSNASPEKVTAPEGSPPTTSRVSCPGTTENSCRSTLLVVEAVRRTHCTPEGGTTWSSAVSVPRLNPPGTLCADGPHASGMTAAPSTARSRLAPLMGSSPHAGRDADGESSSVFDASGGPSSPWMTTTGNETHRGPAGPTNASAAPSVETLATVGEPPTEPDPAHTKNQEAYPRTFRDCDPR